MRSTIIALVCVVFVLVTIVISGHWELQKGVSPPVVEHFTDNGDGTVADNRTGLIWLKNANCFRCINWHIENVICNSKCPFCGVSIDGVGLNGMPTSPAFFCLKATATSNDGHECKPLSSVL